MLLSWTCLALLASSLGLAAAQESSTPEVKSIPVSCSVQSGRWA